jgi:hypothetical protein
MKPPPQLEITERQFTAQIAELAKMFKWTRYHTWLSRYSPPGFPDEVLIRPPRLIFAELKRDTGKLTDAQQGWVDILQQIPAIEVYVWRPADLNDIARILQ